MIVDGVQCTVPIADGGRYTVGQGGCGNGFTYAVFWYTVCIMVDGITVHIGYVYSIYFTLYIML
jgi:hypothetical protein